MQIAVICEYNPFHLGHAYQISQIRARFGGGAGAGVKVDPVAFLIVKDGMTRVMPVAMPAATTVDRVLDLVPEVLDRMQNFVDKKREEKDIY